MRKRPTYCYHRATLLLPEAVHTALVRQGASDLVPPLLLLAAARRRRQRREEERVVGRDGVGEGGLVQRVGECAEGGGGDWKRLGPRREGVVVVVRRRRSRRGQRRRLAGEELPRCAKKKRHRRRRQRQVRARRVLRRSAKQPEEDAAREGPTAPPTGLNPHTGFETLEVSY